MDKTAEKALTLLREVKSVTFATVKRGLPAARIIDVMLVKPDGLYFLTARGKSFFRQLKADPKIAICGMDKKYVSVRVVGDIKFCNSRSIIDEIFTHNPMMNDLYPGDKRDILEGFRLCRGKGEIFDLSVEPPKRKRFAFGGETVNPAGYRINSRCTACGLCLDACPVDVISEGDVYQIDSGHCLECGRCAEVCPEDVIEAAKGI
jgi:uncharacterized pyridoxamine 5'-phosphate oxidase family protein